jgi:hypothetical protein
MLDVTEPVLSQEYVAGFFDGEGSIGIYPTYFRKRPSYYLRTQVTQNVNALSDRLFNLLRAQHGGSLTLVRGVQNWSYNWQLNARKAANFLEWIEPRLQLKREQAQLAIAWYKQRPPLIRNARGQIAYAKPPVLVFDQKVYELVRALKKTHLDDVLSHHSQFVEVVNILRHGVREASANYFIDSSFPRSRPFTADLSAP